MNLPYSFYLPGLQGNIKIEMAICNKLSSKNRAHYKIISATHEENRSRLLNCVVFFLSNLSTITKLPSR